MNKPLKKLVFLSLFVSAFLISQPCYAQDAFTKLGRGVSNTLTGWVELPKNIYNTSAEDNAFAGLTLGTAKGVGMAIVRTGAGLYEVATFPFPINPEYRPVLEPEYVF